MILAVFLFVALLSLSVGSPTDDTLSFLLLGDWGKGGTSGAHGSVVVPGKKAPQANDKTYYQMAIAQAMGQYASTVSPRPSFVLALGDNFYSNGVSSATDILWSYLWKNVYLINYPDLYIPWYPVFGNHDYGGSTDAQIQRFLDHSDDDIWMFESSYYLKTFPIPDGGTVAILFIDTTTLAPSENKCCNAKGGISTDVQQQRIAAQMAFINESLESLSGANRPTWLFVSGHYPVFSAGDKGDTDELLLYLLPLLESYGVDAYFCGHDHISEHLQYGATHHFVAGAGSMTDKLGSTISQADMLWYGVGYSAFAAVNVTYTSFTVQYINAYGSQVYQYTVTNNHTRSPSKQPTEQTDIHSMGRQFFNRLGLRIRALFDEATRDPKVVMSGSLVSVSILLVVCFVMYSRAHKVKKDKKTQFPSRALATARISRSPKYSQISPPVSPPSHTSSSRKLQPTQMEVFTTQDNSDDSDDSSGEEYEAEDIELGVVGSTREKERPLIATAATDSSTTSSSYKSLVVIPSRSVASHSASSSSSSSASPSSQSSSAAATKYDPSATHNNRAKYNRMNVQTTTIGRSTDSLHIVVTPTTTPSNLTNTSESIFKIVSASEAPPPTTTSE